MPKNGADLKRKKARMPRGACAPGLLADPGLERPFRIRWECEDKNRYYEVHANMDLFGEWVLTKAWGRRGSALGNCSQHVCQSYGEAIDRLEEIAVRRNIRKYRQSHVPHN